MPASVTALFQTSLFWITVILATVVFWMMVRLRWLGPQLLGLGFVLIQWMILIVLLKISLGAVLIWTLISLMVYTASCEPLRNRFPMRYVWVACLGVLLLFHHDRFLENLPSWMPFHRRVGLAVPYLTIGYSYMTLRLISFAIDCRSGKNPSPTFQGFLAYIFFVPAFIAGPIDRYARITPELTSPIRLSGEALLAALVRIVTGAFKKIVLVGLLSGWALNEKKIYGSTSELWLGLYAYSWLLYLDFSAYSDLAIGTGMLFGIRLPENFRWSYFRRNIIEFWNNWHMTLSSWLRDYLFLPIGQRLFRFSAFSKKPFWIATAAYLVTMVFCGFWHGLFFHFAVWGAYHGLGLSLCKAIKTWAHRTPDNRFFRFWNHSPLGACFSTVLTFHFVAIGWLLFIYDTPVALHVLRQMAGHRI